MLIVRTIPDTVLYHTEINKQLKERGIHNKIKTLIGFSGKTDYNGEEITETYINKENGFDEFDSITSSRKVARDSTKITLSYRDTSFSYRTITLFIFGNESINASFILGRSAISLFPSSETE